MSLRREETRRDEGSNPEGLDRHELARLVVVERERRRRQKLSVSAEDYLVGCGFERTPVMLAVARVLERVAGGEAVREIISAPPRHGKTDGFLRGFAWLLFRNPALTHAYTTYGTDFALSMSKKARSYAVEWGVALDPGASSVKEWRTEAKGGLLAVGARGPLTGQGVSGLALVDDPFKNREEAESSLVRDRVDEWFRDVLFTRLEGNASVVVMATRWHEDDLSGRLAKRGGWSLTNLPAVGEDGGALWPSGFPRAKLDAIRDEVGEYTWWSLYMGEPRPRGASVFQDVRFYDELPAAGYRVGAGGDWAYTARSRSDYSVVLTAREHEGRLFVTGMTREQEEPQRFAARLTNAGPIHAFMGGAEKPILELFRALGVHVIPMNASADKFSRAQPAAAAWNEGKILLPSPDHEAYGPWVQTLVDEVLAFTGVNDRHDDIVDALAALHHALRGKRQVVAKQRTRALRYAH